MELIDSLNGKTANWKKKYIAELISFPESNQSIIFARIGRISFLELFVFDDEDFECRLTASGNLADVFHTSQQVHLEMVNNQS